MRRGKREGEERRKGSGKREKRGEDKKETEYKQYEADTQSS